MPAHPDRSAPDNRFDARPSAAAAQRPRAIVVDDNPMVLLDACGILEEAGFDCEDAADGDSAWHVIGLARPPFSLLFSDVEMPGGLNGLELARCVSNRYPDIEIVLASGCVRPTADQLPGNTTFIAKPFSATIIHEHLRAKLSAEKTPLPLKMSN